MKVLFWSMTMVLLQVLHVVFVSGAEDQNASCGHWADIGECDKNPGYMLENCAASCDRVAREMLEANKELEGIESFYDLEAKDIHGDVVSFSEFRDQVTILVNVASYCGYTESHYQGLVNLWSRLSTETVEILAFPCNQFGGQEPESNERILEFAKRKGVTFRMMDKIDVNGPNASLVYKYIKQKTGVSNIGWNFATYFVVGKDGEIQALNGVEPTDLFPTVSALLSKDEL